MKAIDRFSRVVLCTSLLSICPGLIPSTSGQTSSSAVTSTPVAYVYVQTNRGVNLYDADAEGRLTLVAGSPFQTVGEMIGSTGTYFVTLGTYWLHLYPVEPNGAIGKQVGTINTQNYAGSACGSTSGAVIDHKGQSVYVLHYNAKDTNGNGICTAYQTFNLLKMKNSGGFVFEGAIVEDTTSTGAEGQLAISANDEFAYAVNDFYEPADTFFYTGLSAFSREGTGALQSISIYWRPPLPPVQNENLWVDFPIFADPDPLNHVAITLYPVWDPPKGSSGPVKIGSFTADKAGNLTTTNTWGDMPSPAVNVQTMKMSPAGNLLAVAGDGLEVFHFRGALPIKPYKVIETNIGTRLIQWDKSNHLYGLSASALYVYTVTPTSLKLSSGSPLKIAGLELNNFVVVPR